MAISDGEVRAGPVSAPIIPVILLGAGFYLCWFAIHYFKSDVKWPTDPLKAVLQGKRLPSAAGTPTETQAQVTKALQQQQATIEQQAQANDANAPGSTASGAAATGIHTAPTATAAANQTLGKLVAAAYGWAPTQSASNWSSLVSLWNQESGWDNNAANPGSGAYGIAQALGHGQGSATQGSVTNQYGGYGISDSMAAAANSGDATAQITWGLQYIKETYGSPDAAWAHEQSNNWY